MNYNIPIIITVIFTSIFLLIGITIYVLRALGLYKLAKNQNINKSWLAWIPVGDAYIEGMLAKNSPYIKSKFPKIHIIYPIVIGAYLILLIGFCVFTLAIGPLELLDSSSNIGLLIAMNLILVPISLAISALAYFVLYHIYKLYDPDNAILYTVLSVLLSLSFVFLFAIRNKNMHSTENSDEIEV